MEILVAKLSKYIQNSPAVRRNRVYQREGGGDFLYSLREQESNLRHSAYEADELPLFYPAVWWRY